MAPTAAGSDSKPPPKAGRSDSHNPPASSSHLRVPSPASQVNQRIIQSQESGSVVRASTFSNSRHRSHGVPDPIVVSRLSHKSRPALSQPGALLAGYPGREIVGAKSDGTEWACDFDAPPVLVSPDDFSKTEFHQHPLMRDLNWTGFREKKELARYGLILPAIIDNGTPTYTWESDEEEEPDRTKALVLATQSRTSRQATPTRAPASLERPRTPSNIITKVKSFAHFVANSDMENEVPELPTLKELLDQFGMPPGTPTEFAPRSFLRPTKSSGSLRPKKPARRVPSATKLRTKRSSGIEKSTISNPVAPEEMRRVGAEFSQAASRTRTRTVSESENISSYAASLRSPSNLISPSISSNMPLYLLQPQHPTVYFGTNEPPPKFRLERPRLAPMEYARQYLLAKAKADKEGEECTVERPGIRWCWSDGHKEFFLLPSIPEGVTRNFLPDEEEKDPDFIKKSRPISSFMDKDEEVIKRRSFIPLPLNITPSSPLMPAHLRVNSQSSTVSTAHKRESSLNAFTHDQPGVVSAEQNLLQSTKALVTDPSVTIPSQSTDFFVAVQTSSESEFARSFPTQFLSASSLGGGPTSRRQAPVMTSGQTSNPTPTSSSFASTLARPQSEQSTTASTPWNDVPPDFPFARPPSVASSQRNVTAAILTPRQAQDLSPATTDTDDDDTRSEITAVYRPGSALSICTVIRPFSPKPATDGDESDVSPSSIDYEDSQVPPAPVSPLTDSPSSPQTDALAPLHGTRTRDTLDDAQTQQQPFDETVLQTIGDNVSDFGDSSSIYSQDSVLTAIHRPPVGSRHIPSDFMSRLRRADETEEEHLTPRQLIEPSPIEPRHQAGTLQPSHILQPVSYVPDTETALSYASSEASRDRRTCRRSQASTIPTDSQSLRSSLHDERIPNPYKHNMETETRDRQPQERRQIMSEYRRDSFTRANVNRFVEVQASINPRSMLPVARSGTPSTHAPETASTISIASSASQHDRFSIISDTHSVTSASTAGSNRSQALSLTSVASSDRSTTSKPSRRSRNDAPFQDIAPGHQPRDAARFPPLNPVMESPASSTGLRISATSPVVGSAGRLRKSSLSNRWDSAHPGESPELPSLKVRRRRDVADLAQIPVSQAYPPPLRFSTMKSPPPTSVSSGTTIMRSTSRLITDIGNELNREMDDVLSPRSAAIMRSEYPAGGDHDMEAETPTRRPRQMRSMRSTGFESPKLPAPTKPLPSLPAKATRPQAASAFVDVDFGPGPVVSHPPARFPPPVPPPQTALPMPPVRATRPPIPVARPAVPPSPSTSGTNSEFVTHADFSVKKDRTVRPAASLAAFPSYRPTPPVAPPQPQRQAHRLESAANLQKPSRTRLLGKMVSMAELKQRRETGSGGGGSGEDTVGMRTFLGEDPVVALGGTAPSAPSSAKEKGSEGGGRKKFFGGLFRKKDKGGEK